MKITSLSVAGAAMLLAAACGKADPAATPEAAASATASATVATEAAVGVEASLGPDAFVEALDGGTVAWNVGADGNVKAAVSGLDGKPIRENLAGSLVWKGAGDAKTVPLTLDAKTGLLVAEGPKLEADLTQIGYSLTVDGKPWTGMLDVPVGGTAALVADARAAADLAVPEGKLGLNGGRIQVVGKERFELVADEVTGEVRAYLLDPDFKAIAVGEHKLTLALTGEAPQIVVLTPAEAGAYLVGKVALVADPIKVTLAARAGAQLNAALVGFKPGVAFSAGAHAPRVKLRVKTDWAARAKLDSNVDLKLKANAPKVDVHANADALAKAGANAKASVKAPSINVKVQAPKISIPKPSVKASAGVHLKLGH